LADFPSTTMLVTDRSCDPNNCSAIIVSRRQMADVGQLGTTKTSDTHNGCHLQKSYVRIGKKE